MDSPSPSVEALRSTLVNEGEPLARRFRALFALKHVAAQKSSTPETSAAIAAISAAFSSPSALLKHELAYCLGQSGQLEAGPCLLSVLQDEREDPMCRHEAAEALGALGDGRALDLLRKYSTDALIPTVIRETCEIALDRIVWQQSQGSSPEQIQTSSFTSIDPAPPLADSNESLSIADLRRTLLNTTLPLFTRYRAMFALRNLACPPNRPTAAPAVLALASGFDDPSALFRHEIAFVFGQLSHPVSIPSLTRVLGNLQEESMVRHEAAEALGSMGDVEGVEQTLRIFLSDPEEVVRDSVVVALDMAEFEQGNELEYVLGNTHQPEMVTVQ